jgi:predicted DNA-binding transcriptional regulator YafY
VPKQVFKNLQKIKRQKGESKPAGMSEKLRRLLKIYTMIAQNRCPSVLDLQNQFEVSERTVHRYLANINLIDPIEFDTQRNGYRFVNGDRLKKIVLSESDFLLLITVGDAVSHLGEAFKETFRSFVDRIISASKKQDDNQHHPVVVKIPDAIEIPHFDEYVRSIFNCIEEKRSMDIFYQTRGEQQSNERRVDPYGLIFYEGAWILIGYCHRRETVRRFALDRISSLKENWRHFKSQEGFDLNKELSQSWGVFQGEKVDITVKFSSEISDLILRKKKWHQSERRELLPNGDVLLSFTVAGVYEIKKWIYAWLPYIEVIEPAWLRRQTHKELTLSAKNHK